MVSESLRRGALAYEGGWWPHVRMLRSTARGWRGAGSWCDAWCGEWVGPRAAGSRLRSARAPWWGCLSGRPDRGLSHGYRPSRAPDGVGKPMAQAPPLTTGNRVIEAPQADRRDTPTTTEPALHCGRTSLPGGSARGPAPGPLPSPGAAPLREKWGASATDSRSTATFKNRRTGLSAWPVSHPAATMQH